MAQKADTSYIVKWCQLKIDELEIAQRIIDNRYVDYLKYVERRNKKFNKNLKKLEEKFKIDKENDVSAQVSRFEQKIKIPQIIKRGKPILGEQVLSFSQISDKTKSTVFEYVRYYTVVEQKEKDGEISIDKFRIKTSSYLDYLYKFLKNIKNK